MVAAVESVSVEGCVAPTGEAALIGKALRLKTEEGLGLRRIAARMGETKDCVRHLLIKAERQTPKLPAIVTDGSALSLYDAACHALAEAACIDEIKTVRDVSEAIRAYARQAKNREMEANAVVLRERAERRLGEKLIEAKAAGQISRGQPPKAEKNCAAPEQFSRVTLEEAGIDRKLSARAQKKAGIADKAFDAMVARMRDDIVTGRRAANILQSAKADVQKEARRELQRVLSDETATLPGGRKMPVIYADPATKFRAGIGNRSIENHYRSMSIDELCNLPVAERCLPDCQLFVWSTVPQLANTITLILPAWGGFEYSSHCMWDKTSPDHEREFGTGFVFRNQHEVLIYATRGRPPGPKVAPPSIYRERKREHSRKPDYFRRMIIDMTGGLPVLELFARVDAEHPLPAGWESWGNQAREAGADLPPHDSETGEITSGDVPRVGGAAPPASTSTVRLSDLSGTPAFKVPLPPHHPVTGEIIELSASNVETAA